MVATGPIAASTQTFALGHLRPHAPPPKYLSGGNVGNGSTHAEKSHTKKIIYFPDRGCVRPLRHCAPRTQVSCFFSPRFRMADIVLFWYNSSRNFCNCAAVFRFFSASRHHVMVKLIIGQTCFSLIPSRAIQYSFIQ